MNDLSHQSVEKTLCCAFAEAVAQHGPAIAVDHPGGTLDYATLDRLSERLAAALVAQGIGPGAIVGLGAAPGPWPIVALLGILRAGAAYLPLPAGYAPDRLFEMLAGAGVRHVLGARPAGLSAEIACHAPETLTAPGAVPALPCPAPGDAAYVMFTSGSTGTPKAVVVPHRAVRRLVVGQEFIRLGPGTRMLQAAPMAFDAATLEIWGPLLNGGTLVLPPVDDGLSLRGLGRVLAQRRITTLWLTAGLFHAMADERPEDFAPLSDLLTGGDVVSPARVARVLAACPGLTVTNGYGPTENTTFTCTHRIAPDDLASGTALPIGAPINGTDVHVLGPDLMPVPEGSEGELCASGAGLALGYLGQPELTAERFVDAPFAPGLRLYRTGDLVRRAGGVLHFLGRVDQQIKLRGYRIEPAGIEAVLERHPGVAQAAAVLRRGASEGADGQLLAFVTCTPGASAGIETALAALAAADLPDHARPARILVIDALPLTPSGKVDRRAIAALPLPPAATPAETQAPGGAATEALIEDALCAVLGQPAPLPRGASFFDLGATSLMIARVHERLQTALARDFPVTDFFRHGTIATLARHLARADADAKQAPAPAPGNARGLDTPIAIVAMAGRFPGAPDVDAFWQAMLDGRELITRFDAQDLDVPLAEGQIAARGVVAHAEWFDAAHFGLTPREADRLDPQHRVLLELAQEVLDAAGHDPDRFAGRIGIFAGASQNSYLLNNLVSAPGAARALAASYPAGDPATTFGNDKDFLCTRIAYKLNLRGPAVTVQAACATSLLAVAQGCAALRAGAADMMLAGGVSITFPARRGYAHAPGGMTSADGHCRAFDADASGTVFGDGAGLVALRRLDDALADGDRVIAVIRGWAVNNDGADKAGFAAPSVTAQAAVIRAAHAAAGVAADTIGYVEAHGTGTALGDPIEIAALTEAFGGTGRALLGTAKTNVGHLDIAAGVTGLIKAAKTVQEGRAAPLLHFHAPNPRIDFAASPVRPVTEVTAWGDGTPRRAGVSAFGVGGTNVHLVLEEAPQTPQPGAAPAPPGGDATATILPLSASSPAALAELATRLTDWARAHPDTPAPQLAAALDRRRRHAHRGVLVVHDLADLPAAPLARAEAGAEAALTLLFPGQGAQYPGMGAAVYRAEAAYRAAFDECADLLAPDLGLNLRDLLFDPDHARTATRLRDTALAQPAIFATSIALARQWAAWGIGPARMAGHSIGEFVAATLAGVFTLPDALRLIALRGRLMADLPPGRMLSVRAPEQALARWLGDGVDLAAVNGAQACVLAGPEAAIDRVAAALTAEGIVAKPLHTSHAFHSAMMDPALPAFRDAVAQVPLAAPATPILSTVTGTWLSAAEATDPTYWADHMRRPVRFYDALQRLWAEGRGVMLEAGPGRTLATLAAQDPARRAVALASLPHAEATEDAALHLRRALGLLWAHGQPVDFARAQAMDKAAHGLPPYPFQRQRHWVAPWEGTPEDTAAAAPAPAAPPTAPAADAATRLRAIMADLSGHAPDDLPGDATFLALGFDSLMLTQAARDISQEFGTEVTLRALIDTFGSIDTLAAHLDATAPKGRAGAAPAPGPVPLAAPAPGSAPMTRISHDAADLTPRQRGHIDRLTARYTAKTARSKALTARYRPTHADPRTASGFNRLWKEIVYQIVTTRSKGSRLLDVDGNEYIDILNGFGPGFLGHGPAPVNDALTAQIAEGYEVGPQSLLAMEASELFCRLTGNDRASFVSTGSEAVAAAMRLARTVTGRDRIVLFARDYHGNFDEVLVRAGGSGTLPLAPGIPRSAVGHVTVLPYGTPEALEYIRANAGQLAAVLVEPVQSRRPEFRPAEFIREVRRLTQANGALMIFDEVVTGFRFGLRGAQGYYGVQADLVTYGKVVGGGMPVGVVAGRAACMDTFDGGQWGYGDDSFPQAPVTFFAGTFVRHPLAMAALKAMLETMAAQPPMFWEAINARGDRLGRTMDRWFADNDMPFALPNCGSLLYLRIDDRAPLAPLIGPHLRDRGVFLLEGFPSYMTAAHDAADIDHVIAAMQDAALEMRADGLIGGREDTTPHTPQIAAAPPRLSLPDGAGRIARDMAAPLPPLPVPTTEAQREIWAAIALNPGVAAAYNESVSLVLRGPLDRAAARAALALVLARHDALRSTFADDGQTMIVAPEAAFDVALHDLTAQTDAARDAAVAALLRAEVETPLPLETGPLVRAHLLAEGPDLHRIVLTAHHIVCDGWSLDVILRETAQAYAALAAGDAPAPALPPAQSILAYARAEADWSATPDAAAARAHWQGVFADTPEPFDLPTDMPRSPDRARRGARVDLTLPAALMHRVRALARTRGATLPAVLLSAWKLHIARAAGVSDITIGLPAAGQAARGLPGVVGHCVNLLPVRSRIDWHASFSDHLAAERTALLDAQEHQLLTFGTILQMLNLPRDPARVPLVPVLFNLDQAADADALRLGDTDATLHTNPRAFEQFELYLNAAPLPDGGLALELAHAADLFSPETAASHLRGFIALLEAACDAPDAPLDGLAGAEAPESWLAPGIGASCPIPGDETIWTLFAAQAAREPDAPALIEGETAVTAAALLDAAETLAARLAARGVGPGVRVGLCLPRSGRAITAMLAILRLGAAWVPMDPTNPDARLRYIAADSAARIVVTDAALAARLELDPARVFDIDAGEGPQPPAAPLPPAPRDASGLAYVAYTSGSTGQPKGVMGPHRPMLNRFDWMWRAYPFQPGEVMAQKTALSFLDCIWEIFGPLLRGVPLVVIPAETVRDPAAFAATLARHRISRLVLVPSLLDAMLDALPDLGAALPDLRLVFVSGERLTASLARRLAAAAPRMRLINLYGSSEIAADVAVHEVTEITGDAVPIGRPLDNTRLYVLDARHRPVAPGRAGTLFVGGAALADGYFNQPDLTAARFLPDPFDPAPGARMFDTGDRVRLDAEGRFEFLGRADAQIALRGYRIELGEIEAALADQPGVADAAVIAAGDDGMRRILGFVTARRDGPAPDPATLRRALAARLPDYMLPARIVLLPAMPLNPNGKTDRQALAALPLPDAPEAADDAPQSPLETEVCGLFAQVLDLRSVARGGDFFELGGHSLLAVKLFARLRRARGIDLPIGTLLNHPTPARLAARIAEVEATQPETTATTDAWDTSVVIAPGPAGTTTAPIFIVGGVGGNVNNLRWLGQALGAHCPVIGLQTRGVAGHAMRDSIAAMARDHVADIRRHQPRGPYRLAGYSGGAWTAFEIARQIEAAGETVAWLGAFDMDAPGTRPRRAAEGARARLRTEAEALRRDGLAGFLRRARPRLRETVTPDTMLSLLRPVMPERVRLTRLARRWRLIARGYAPEGPVQAALWLYLAQQDTPEIAEAEAAAAGWRLLARGGVHLRRTPGNHLTMLNAPQVADLAAAIAADIDMPPEPGGPGAAA